MAFTRRIFTKEFRLNAAKLVVDEHRPAVDVARELDINPKLLDDTVSYPFFAGQSPCRLTIPNPCIAGCASIAADCFKHHLTAKIPLVPSRQRLRVCAPNCRSPAPRYCC